MPSKSLLFVFAAFLVGCDHATKLAAERVLTVGGRVIEVVPGVLDLHYACNDDTAFSLLRGIEMADRSKAALLLGLSALGTLAVVVAWFRRRAKAPFGEQLAWAAIAAGAIGNVVDRAARGCVIDFVRLPHWPVFNVADVCVVAGVLGVAVSRRRTLLS
jgi:signal peptidase II